MIIFGVVWKSYPHKSVNRTYGYRTSMSMKNNETWKFAHGHNGMIWRWVGLIAANIFGCTSNNPIFHN